MSSPRFPAEPAPPAEPAWQPRRGQQLLALSAIFFGAMAVAARGASAELGAAQIVVVRFLLGLLGVGVVVSLRPSAFKATRPGLLLLRGLLGGGAVLGYFMAIERLSAGLGTLLNYTFPLWAAAFAALFLREAVTLRLLAGFALATTGLIVVLGPEEIRSAVGGLGDPRVRLGLLAGIGSSILGGGAVVTIRALRRTDSALAVFAAFCGFGLLVVLPGAIADWRPISARGAALLLLVGGLSFIAQMLFTYALKFVPAGAGSLTAQLTVVASYGFAAITLGEPITWQAGLGAAIVLSGVVLASMPPREVAPVLSPESEPARPA